MAYWLFYIMDFVVRTGCWTKQIECGIAAQQYPDGWDGEERNVALMRKIERGDWIIAGRACRFAGYGRVTAGFYRGGESLRCPRGDGRIFPFHERIDVEWYLTPGWEDDKNWLDLHVLKTEMLKTQREMGGSSSYSPIDFTVGRCVKEIDREVFEALRKRLDQAGAQPVGRSRGESIPPDSEARNSTSWDRLLDEEPLPPQVATFLVTRPVRSSRNRLAAKERANWSCEVPDCEIPIFEHANSGKPYVEAHHLDPLGAKGPEHLSNIAVVCAWHHALLTHGPERDAKRIAKQLKAVRGMGRKV